MHSVYSVFHNAIHYDVILGIYELDESVSGVITWAPAGLVADSGAGHKSISNRLNHLLGISISAIEPYVQELTL